MSDDHIGFTAFDLLAIAMLAERRNCVKGVTRARSKRYDTNKTDFETHYLGVMGEWGVHLKTGADIDTTVLGAGDDGVDMTVYGHQCHVKAFTFGGRDLEFFVDDMKAFSAPVGIGVQIISPVQVRIMGCISRKLFERMAHTKNYGYGERLFVPEGTLSPLSVLRGESND